MRAWGDGGHEMIGVAAGEPLRWRERTRVSLPLLSLLRPASSHGIPVLLSPCSSLRAHSLLWTVWLRCPRLTPCASPPATIAAVDAGAEADWLEGSCTARIFVPDKEREKESGDAAEEGGAVAAA